MKKTFIADVLSIASLLFIVAIVNPELQTMWYEFTLIIVGFSGLIMKIVLKRKGGWILYGPSLAISAIFMLYFTIEYL